VERNVPARSYHIRGVQPTALVVWFHGGAFVGGSLDMPEAEITSMELAQRSGALVVSVDYWLCTDELRFPASQQDGFESLLWAVSQAEELDIPTSRIFVGGGSAGACLAGSVSLLARDRGIALGGVMPIYPIAHSVHPKLSEELNRVLEGEMFLPEQFIKDHNRWLSDLAAEQEIAQWYCFPGDAQDKSGLPPHLIIQAEIDSLRPSGDKWAEQLRGAGVLVIEDLMLGAGHGYLNRHPSQEPAMDRTLTLMADFVRSAT
jgi:acetyl esterase